MSARRAHLAAVVCTAAVAPTAPAAAASPAAPRVETMVVGRHGEKLAAARVRTARTARARVAGVPCIVGAATPLAALLATPLSLRLKDFGSCSARARDAAGLFVTTVAGQRNRGSDGWVYKVGPRAGTAGAADLGGAFGDGHRLRSGQRVLWFWCVMGAKGCQRTLEVTPRSATVGPGEPVAVSVRARDDRGAAVAAAGARVTLGSARVTTDAAGNATLVAPPVAGGASLRATAPGLVRAFPERVTVTGGG